MRRLLVPLLCLSACGGGDDGEGVDAGLDPDAAQGDAAQAADARPGIDVIPVRVSDAAAADSVTSGDDCVTDEVQTMVCASGGGSETRTCVDGAWGPWSTDCTPRFTTVEMSNSFACGVKEDGTTTCDNGGGGELLAGDGFVDLVGESAAYCGLKTDGTVVCAGITAPTGTFKQLASNDTWPQSTVCGIKPDDTVTCWGEAALTFPSGTFKKIALTDGIGCGIRTDDTIACTGVTSEDFPVPGGTFKELSLAIRTFCAIRTDGTLFCDTADLSMRPVLQQVPSGMFTKVSTAGLQTCALRVDQTIACWGWEVAGATWPPSGTYQDLDLDEGGCALTTDGRIECWHTQCGEIPFVGTVNRCETCGPVPACQCGGVTYDCDRGCDDGDNTQATGTSRPDTNDGVDDYLPVTGTVGQNDRDFYKVHVDDQTFSIISADLKLTPASGQTLSVCLGFKYDATGNEYFYKCAWGSSTSPALLEQSLGEGLGSGDDSGVAVIDVTHVAGPPTCGSYTLEYRF
jgi:hypothetical protein